MSKKREIYKVFASLENIEDVENLLQDILTDKELDEIEARWNLAKSLCTGKTQRTVKAETKVSIATVTRWAKLLRSGTGGLKKEILKFLSELEENENLENLRDKIDTIDSRIIRLLKSRFELMPLIARIKKRDSLHLRHKLRERQTIQKKVDLARKYKINQKFIEKIFLEIITESKKEQLPYLLSHQLPEIKKLKSQFTGKVLPVFIKIKNTQETPHELYKKIIKDEPYSFIFEQYERAGALPRYSFLGMKPKKVLRFKDRVFELLDLENSKSFIREFDDPLKIMKRELKTRELLHDSSLPDFIGGAIGFIGADSIRYFEKSVSLSGFDDLNLLEAVYGFYDDLIIFDHQKKDIMIVSLLDLDDDLEQKYEKLLDHFFKILALFDEPIKSSTDLLEELQEDLDFSSIYERREFIELVELFKDKIKTREILKINLSQRFEIKSKLPSFKLYSQLKDKNSRVSCYFNYPDFSVIGVNPECQLQVQNKYLDVTLLTNEKSKKVIFSDLINSEFQQISKLRERKDSVIKNKKELINSVVSGQLNDHHDSLDALKVFFLGNLSAGVPKVRSLQLLGQYEKCRRGFFGAVFHCFGYNGNLNASMCEEVILKKDSHFYIQTGSVVSHDSVPESVYEETLLKARNFLEMINKSN